MGTSIAGSVPPLYSSYQDSTLFTYYKYIYIYTLLPPSSRLLQSEEMWGASRHLRLETKPKCELSQDNFQILAFWST